MKWIAIAFTFTLGVASAYGQAWLPPAGNTSVLLAFERSHIDTHSTGSGKRNHDVDMRPRMLMLSVDQGLTDRLALGISVPYIETRYRGTAPAHPGLADNGRKHGTLQDINVSLRYAAIEGPVAVTPFARMSWPARNYQTLGHSSPGRGLQEQEAGVALGYEIPLLQGTWVSGTYGYTWVEKIDDHISTNRSAFEAQIVRQVTPRLFARLFGTRSTTHGGLDVPLTPHEREEHFHHHDQLLRTNSTRAGVAVSFALTPAIDAHAAYATTIRSENAHAGRSVSIGTSWNFDARRMLARFRSARGPALAAHLRNRDAIF